MAGALTTVVAGAVHPKGSSDVGTLEEWLTRVGDSSVWVLDHYLLALAAVLVLVVAVAIADSYPEEQAARWGRFALATMVVAAGLTILAFLVDGPVLKETAERWQEQPEDAANLGAARAITDIGFILVAGFQLVTGLALLLFGVAGLMTSVHSRWHAWLALVAGAAAVIPASAHYLAGASTWSVNFVYVSSGLFSLWIFVMGYGLWRRAKPGVSTASP